MHKVQPQNFPLFLWKNEKVSLTDFFDGFMQGEMVLKVIFFFALFGLFTYFCFSHFCIFSWGRVLPTCLQVVAPLEKVMQLFTVSEQSAYTRLHMPSLNCGEFYKVI